jgi:hypothetical protein
VAREEAVVGGPPVLGVVPVEDPSWAKDFCLDYLIANVLQAFLLLAENACLSAL